jgi:hypothetical protein
MDMQRPLQRAATMLALTGAAGLLLVFAARHYGLPR